MPRTQFYGAVVLLALNATLSGCTLVGYGAGAMADASNKREFGPSIFARGVESSGTLRRGEKIELVLRDGEIVEGTYLKIEQLPSDDYAERYLRARRRHAPQITLPELGDTVTLTHVSGEVLEGEFRGFEYQRWVVFEDGALYWLPTDYLAGMTAGDYCNVSGEVLDDLFSEGELPTLSALALEVVVREGSKRRRTKRLISLDSIQSGTHKPTSGRMLGGAFGVALDMIFVAAAVAALPTFPDYGAALTFGGG